MAPALRFERCGHNVTVKEGGLERTHFYQGLASAAVHTHSLFGVLCCTNCCCLNGLKRFGHVAVCTSRCLPTAEVFTVEILRICPNPYLSFGITMRSKTGFVEPLQPHHALWFNQKIDGAPLASDWTGTEPCEADVSHLTQPTSLGDGQSGSGSSSSGGTGGYSKLQRKRDTIIGHLADLGFTGQLAEKLLGADMITRRIYDHARNVAPGMVEMDRAAVLFNAVLASVKLNPAKYAQFISILQQTQGSSDLVDFIEAS